jgi:hypothetical protein
MNSSGIFQAESSNHNNIYIEIPFQETHKT